MTPEGRIKHAICQWLHFKQALIFVHDSVGIYNPRLNRFMANKNPYRLKGVADLIGIWKGRPLAIEVKQPGAYATSEQKKFLARWVEHGGIGFIARSIADVERELTGVSEP